ncbi:MAG: tripartite tricarboxylate transporter substrate binding protein [Betaproteobacteria bacterium]|nr:tripartite tricarboxylate transporter substrate binding protein [Betaproteobacteria bacterium]
MKHPQAHIRPALFAAALSLGTLILGATAAMAQQYPSKPIRMLIPFAAGGGTDVMGRLLGQKMSESMGVPVIIDNKPGSDTIVAADILAKSAPDGYTIDLTLDIAVTVNPFTYSRGLPYDPVKDLAPVSLVGITDLLMVANNKLPARTIPELVAYAKANPGKLNYGSGAVSAQLVVEMLKQTTGINMVFIPFKGAAPTSQALLAGDIDLAIADFFSFLPLIKAGKIKPMAVTGLKRDPSLPDVPTFTEAGYPNVQLSNWWGVYAPAKTPPAIIDRLAREIQKAVALPDFQERVRGMAAHAVSSTPAELAARQKADADKLGAVIKAAGIKVD